MEVEVLLYRFKHPSTEVFAFPSPCVRVWEEIFLCHCTSVSLMKQRDNETKLHDEYLRSRYTKNLSS